MADQGKWFKLWCDALHDAALENLTPQEWYCWVRLGAYIKAHGTNGKVEFEAPATALTYLFHVPDFETALGVVKRFPHCVYEEIRGPLQRATDAIVALKIEYLNWHKYQADYSTDRSRTWRAKRRQGATLQEEKRRDVEEKRIPQTPAARPSTPKVNGQGAPRKPEGPIMTGADFKRMRRVIKANLSKVSSAEHAIPK